MAPCPHPPPAEWMVTDFTKFNAGALPSKGFFHVLNQLPGHVVTKDMTDRIATDLYVWQGAHPEGKTRASISNAFLSFDQGFPLETLRSS